jgi:hypothetical protein
LKVIVGRTISFYQIIKKGVHPLIDQLLSVFWAMVNEQFITILLVECENNQMTLGDSCIVVKNNILIKFANTY